MSRTEESKPATPVSPLRHPSGGPEFDRGYLHGNRNPPTGLIAWQARLAAAAVY